MTTQQWRVFELILNTDKNYVNPFLDVDITAAFTGPNGERAGEDVFNEILLPRLPEGLEEKIGPLAWEERAEDGALCARLTSDEAELALELASEQGINGVCVGYGGADGDEWILVLQPN